MWFDHCMALITTKSSTNRSPERDKFSELIREKDQVKDLLNDLKSEVAEQEKDWDASRNTLDRFIESNIFDEKALKSENRNRIENYIKKWNYNAVQELLNKWIDEDPDIQWVLDGLRSAVSRDILFELNTLELDALKNSITNWQEASKERKDSPPNPELWITPGEKPSSGSYEPFHEFIDKDPRSRSYQALSPLTWNEDIDRNNNDKVTRREMRKAGILDRYRQSDRDIRKAVDTILNSAEKNSTLNKRELRWINREDMTTILYDVIDLYYTQEGNQDTKIFRKEFRERFIQSDQYNKKWLWARKDINRIINILEKWLDNPDVESQLKHLADMGSNAKNINIVWASNDITLLESWVVNKKNVFLFLCDFDSDGTVDSTNITKQRKNLSRRDTWSVMGLQLYQNLAAKADLDKDNTINDGPKTALLIEHIVQWIKSKSSTDGQTRQAIEQYIKTQKNKESWWFTIQSLIDFMQKPLSITDSQGKSIKKVSGVFAVKSYLESLANESNEWTGDVADIFATQPERTAVLKENAESAVNIAKIYSQVDIGLQQYADNYGEAELAYARRTTVDKVLQFINYFTDTLYANLEVMRMPDDVLRARLADVFYPGAPAHAVWAISQRFFFPDGTRNQRAIYDALGNFVTKQLSTGIKLAVDSQWNPLLWFGLNKEQLSDNLNNRFAFMFDVGAILPVLNRFNQEIPRDFRLGINIGIEKTRQTKNSKQETRNQSRKSPVPTVRAWFSVGAGFEFVTQWLYARLWPVRDRDFPAGIEQKWREFDFLLMSLLDANDHNFTNASSFTQSLRKKIQQNAEKDPRFANNRAFLDDMAVVLWEKMQRAGVFDVLNSSEYQNSNNKKTQLLQFFYRQFIDGFHENAINQKLYNQLAGQGAKITKVNIAAIVWTSVAAIALAPATGWLSLASVVPAIGASVRMSTFRNSFVADAYKTRSNYEKIQTRKNMDIAPEFTNLHDAAKHLAQQLNTLEPGKPNIISVKANEEDGTFRISLDQKALEDRNLRADSILTYLNIYHSPDADGGFRFENGELILWQADVHIGRIVKRDRVEFHMMLWSDINAMTKLTGTTNLDKPIAWYEKSKDIPAPLTIDSVIELVDGLNNVEDEDALIDAIWEKCKDMPTPVRCWSLHVKHYTDGRYVVKYEHGDANQTDLTLSYEVVALTDNKEFKEIWEKIQINLESAFGYVSENPNAYEKLRNDLDRLGREYATELYETATAAINRGSSPDLLYKFLEPLSNLDYQQASQALIAVLEKKHTTIYRPYIALLKQNDLPDNQRILLCNKFRHLLAYNATSIKLFTGSWYSNINTLGGLVTRRKNAYESMASSRDMPDIFKTNGPYYRALYDKTKNRTSYELADAPNTLWYTAFYRTREKHFGIAHPGETKIVSNWGEIAKVTVKPEDVAKTADRYFAQLEKNTEEFNIIKNAINKKLEDAKVWTRIGTVYELKQLTLGKAFTTDSKDKKRKEVLTFDSKFVFYLMWECTNESLWLEINGISITRKVEQPVEETIKTKQSRITPEIKEWTYDISWKSGLYNNEYDVQVRQRDLTIGAAVKTMFRGKAPVDGPYPGGTNPDDPIDQGSGGWQNDTPVIDWPTGDWQNPNWSEPRSDGGAGGQNG